MNIWWRVPTRRRCQTSTLNRTLWQWLPPVIIWEPVVASHPIHSDKSTRSTWSALNQSPRCHQSWPDQVLSQGHTDAWVITWQWNSVRRSQDGSKFDQRGVFWWEVSLFDCSGEPIQCKICWGPPSGQDPLIQICACQGTVRYLHIMCLKQWIEKQIIHK